MEKKTLHETKGDSVAKGEQGLFNFDLHSVVFYVGGYPSSFMVRGASGSRCVALRTSTRGVACAVTSSGLAHSLLPCMRLCRTARIVSPGSCLWQLSWGRSACRALS